MVTSIKQSLVLKGRPFLVLAYQILYELNLSLEIRRKSSTRPVFAIQSSLCEEVTLGTKKKWPYKTDSHWSDMTRNWTPYLLDSRWAEWPSLYLIDSEQRSDSNQCPLLKSASLTPLSLITVQLKGILKSESFCLFFSNRPPILKSMAVSHFLKLTSNDVFDVCPNPNSNQ
jgi:hypothetical protein